MIAAQPEGLACDFRIAAGTPGFAHPGAHL
jgi:hypothetical protein